MDYEISDFYYKGDAEGYDKYKKPIAVGEKTMVSNLKVIVIFDKKIEGAIEYEYPDIMFSNGLLAIEEAKKYGIKMESETDEFECPDCKGKGKINFKKNIGYYNYDIEVECKRCAGKGKFKPRIENETLKLVNKLGVLEKKIVGDGVPIYFKFSDGEGAFLQLPKM